MDDLGFKFKIGDFTRMKGLPMIENSDNFRLSRRMEVRYLIIERLYQECPGGVQRHYTCRPIINDGGVGREYMRINEVELIPSGPFENEEEKK